jgi:hypothetical protein
MRGDYVPKYPDAEAARSVLEVLEARSARPTSHTPAIDVVNHPPHYADHPSMIECVDIAEHLSFNLGNALKYLWRAGKKHPEKLDEDLRKALWYLEREKEALMIVTSHEIVQPGSESVIRVLCRKVIEKEPETAILGRALRHIVNTTDGGFENSVASPESAITAIEIMVHDLVLAR